MCKKIYLEVMFSELNVGKQNTNVVANIDYEDIVTQHMQDLAHWDILIPSDMQQLPTLYWLPKMHKSPYSSRFIAASNKCTTKPLSCLLTICLSTIIKHFQEYCNGIFRNTGINCFW